MQPDNDTQKSSQDTNQAPIYMQDTQTVYPAPNDDHKQYSFDTHSKDDSKQGEADVFGIVSIILAITGLSLFGIFFGYFGMKKAKENGYPVTISKVGFWLSLVFALITLPFAIFLILFAFSGVATL